MSILLPPWMKYWVSLFSLNWLTTLRQQTFRVSIARNRLVGKPVTYVNFLEVSTVMPFP
jgi:hypothetical protein